LNDFKAKESSQGSRLYESHLGKIFSNQIIFQFSQDPKKKLRFREKNEKEKQRCVENIFLWVEKKIKISGNFCPSK